MCVWNTPDDGPAQVVWFTEKRKNFGYTRLPFSSVYHSSLITLKLTHLCSLLHCVPTSLPSVPPDPASNLQVTGRSTETFDLTWNNPVFDGNSPLTVIRIEYQMSGSSDVMSANTGVVEMATLTDLRPFTSYNINVLVLNDVGSSDPESIAERTDSLCEWMGLEWAGMAWGRDIHALQP